MGGAGVLPGVQITWWSELQVPFKSIIPLLSGQECGAVSLMFHYSLGVTWWYAGSWQIPLANQAGTKNAGEILLQGLYNSSFSSEPLPGRGLLCPKQCLALWGILMAERGCCWHVGPRGQGHTALFLVVQNCTGGSANMACSYMLPCLISWGMHHSTRDSLACPPDPE